MNSLQKKHFFIKSKKNRLDVPLPFKGSRQLVLSNEKTLSPINVLESFFPNGHPYTIDEIMKRDILNVLFLFNLVQLVVFFSKYLIRFILF